MTTRVVQWATGATGRHALRAVIEAAELELAGVRVYDHAKVGVDAGVLAGTSPTGVVATADITTLLDLRADVVLYMGRIEQNPDGCLAEVVEILESGSDVIATGSSLMDPGAVDPAVGRAIDEACRKGQSTFLGLGLFPGYWGEVMVPVLARLMSRIGTVTVRESLSYAGYPSAQLLFDVMGYGHAPDSEEPLLARSQTTRSPFVGTISLIAKSLGMGIDQVEPYRLVAVTDSDITVEAGLIPAGTVGAMKLGVRARCGNLSVLVEHVTWMGPEVEPAWSGREGYEIEIDGAPSLRCNLLLGTKGEDHTDMGCLATAMHAVNAIPAVRAAKPGVLDLADLGDVAYRHR